MIETPLFIVEFCAVNAFNIFKAVAVEVESSSTGIWMLENHEKASFVTFLK